MDTKRARTGRIRGVRHALAETGAAGLEYVAGVITAAFLVGAVFIAISPQSADIRGAVCCAVGQVVQTDLGCAPGGGDTEDEALPPTDQDFEPEKCKIHETGDEYSSVIKIGFIEIGENAGFVVTEYSDGTVTMMATNGAEIGATGGFGADAAWGEMEAEAKIDFGGGVTFDYGSTWSFENQDQANEFRDDLDAYLMYQYQITHPTCAMGTCIPYMGPSVDPPPVPSTTFGGIGVNGDVTGDLGISAGSDTPLSTTQLTDQGFSASLSPQAQWTVTNDNGNTPDDASDDTRTYVTDMSLNGELTGQVGLATGGGGSMVGMSLSVKKDADGNIIEIQIVSTSEVTSAGGGEGEAEVNNGGTPTRNGGSGSINAGSTNGDVVVTETTLALDPENAEQQQIATDWLGGTGNYEWPGLISLNDANPAQADPDDPFGTLLFENATSSSIAYDHVTDVAGFALNVKFGMAFGVDFSMENSETTATEATYLGAPRADGTRPVLDYTECVA
ncbi:hypothetical protein [Janibacter sp. G1551]|uniref:hypothetical protein n=1 Tax=Janibacter sp. G1551 TaxID=3420440 RepID=UPI003CFC9C12